MENLSISDLRILLGKFYFDFSKFLDDSEVSRFRSSAGDPNDTVCSFAGSCTVDLSLVSAQDDMYDRLDVYIKLLNELSKCRPLPF